MRVRWVALLLLVTACAGQALPSSPLTDRDIGRIIELELTIWSGEPIPEWATPEEIETAMGRLAFYQSDADGDLTEQIRAQMGDSFGGYWLSFEDGSLHVGYVGVPPELDLGFPVVLHERALSLDDARRLAEARDQVYDPQTGTFRPRS